MPGATPRHKGMALRDAKRLLVMRLQHGRSFSRTQWDGRSTIRLTVEAIAPTSRIGEPRFLFGIFLSVQRASISMDTSAMIKQFTVPFLIEWRLCVDVLKRKQRGLLFPSLKR